MDILFYAFSEHLDIGTVNYVARSSFQGDALSQKKRVSMLGGIPRIYNKKAVYAVKALIRLQLS